MTMKEKAHQNKILALEARAILAALANTRSSDMREDLARLAYRAERYIKNTPEVR